MDTSIKPLVPGDDLEKQWKFFQWQFDGYITFNETRSAWSKENQAKALMHLIGLDCAYLFESATVATKKDPDLLRKFISDKVKPVTNECFERYMFKQMRRRDGEDVNQYVARCREKIEKCGFPAGFSTDFLIMDSLVHNLQDLTLQQHFFRTKELKLAKVIEDLQIHEAGQSQLKEIQTCRAQLTPVATVQSVTESRPRSRERRRSNERGRSRTRRSSSGARSSSKHRSSSKSKKKETKNFRRRSSSNPNAKSYRARSQTPGRRVSTDGEEDCSNCGYSHGSDWCPARDRKCHTCKRMGHFHYMCLSSSNKTSN